MQLSDIPAKFQTVWAVGAGGAYIRTPPQTPSGQPGAADWEQGFPPLNFTQVAGGGVPPFGQDFNGLLQEITAWGQWAQAGGAQPFDATFASEIGGYPRSCILPAASQAGVWYNLADNNTANPDTGGSNWVLIGPGMDLGGDLSGTVANAIINNGVIVAPMLVANTLTGAEIEQAPGAGVFGALAAGNGGWLNSAQLQTIIGLAGNLAGTGHISIPVASGGSLIINWGFTSTGGGSGTATFDLPFTTAIYVGLATGNVTAPATVESPTLANMRVNSGSPNTGAYWIAIGR